TASAPAPPEGAPDVAHAPAAGADGAAARRTAEGPAGPRSKAAFVMLLGCMAGLPAVSTDMYLPSLPQVASELGTSTAAVQLTMTGMLVGGAVGQLVIGPLADRFGRRRPVLVGVALHVLVSLLCMVAPTIEVLVGLRVLHGFFNAAATVVALAVIRDRFTGAEASRVMSRLMLVIGAAPLLAPTAGGWIAQHVGWRGVFGVLGVLGVALWVYVLRALPETLPARSRRPGGLGTALRGYGSLVRDRRFVALAVLPGLGMAVLMSYVVSSPFVLQEEYGLSSGVFSLVFAINGMALVAGAQVNAAIVHRVGPLAILRTAPWITAALTVTLLVLALTGAGGLTALLVVLLLTMAMVNFVPPNASTLALARHGQIAGTAAAVLGAFQAGVAGVVSPLTGVLGERIGDQAVAMALVMAGGALLAVVVLVVGTPAYRWGRAPGETEADILAADPADTAASSTR
uniref:multidrug effflux MFS transporter n=1 Tax=Cellulomonas endophytica TaxID=2494735 RepID=UPI0023EA52AB